MEIFTAICNRDFRKVQRIVKTNPKCVNIKNKCQWTPLDEAISYGPPEAAKLLWIMGGQPNLEIYRDGEQTPVHWAVMNGYIDTLKWVFEEILPLSVLQIKCREGWSPLDWAIAWGKLEVAKFLWKEGGRPNLENYRDGGWTPVHHAADGGDIATLKWGFENKVFPRSVLNIKNQRKETPLDRAIFEKQWETAAFLRRLVYVDPVFLAMQRAKHDHECVLRQLPDELLDMVVDEVAVRFHLVVEWYGL